MIQTLHSRLSFRACLTLCVITMTTLMRVPAKLHSYLQTAREDEDIAVEDVQTQATACDLIHTLVLTK